MDYSKSGIKHLASIFKQKGINTLIISPGSRNAPITIAFKQVGIECLSIVDERSAAFFALGMAQQSGNTIAIACTSGSAVLNYAPAISEAFYQRVPLLILTADRPNEWIDQEDSQTIRQKDIYHNYIKKSFEIPQNISSEDDLWFADRLINEAVDNCQLGPKGPVHINLPFKEPLYEGFDVELAEPKIIQSLSKEVRLPENEVLELTEKWNQSKKKLILCGMLNPSKKLNNLLNAIAQDPSVSILTETTANVSDPLFNSSIDRILSGIPEDKMNDFTPDLVVTIGNQIISKRIKAYLRQHKSVHNWHISADDLYLDTFQSLSINIPVKPCCFFSQMIEHIVIPESNYAALWKSIDETTQQKHDQYIRNCEYSDLRVFDQLLARIPEGSNLQMGNSTVVRYIQLFPKRNDISYHGNRGTSGIDGSLSTAAGAAYVSQKLTTLIIGDLSFFYDSNGLWNNYLSSQFKIIIINNGGGGIFRFIDGPAKSNALEYFETPHQLTAENIAKTFGVEYLSANTANEVSSRIEQLYTTDKKTCILEIFTPRELNVEILKSYFKYLATV